MKTAIVTTCYLDVPEYLEKTKRWLNYYYYHDNQLSGSLFLLDNNSSFFNINELDLDTGPRFLYQRFTKHYTRESHLSYKYLWRAVYFIQQLLKEYDKVIYMDNDLFLLSKNITDYINNLNSGWTTFYCKKHNFPETGIHIICKDNTSYNNFVKDLTEEEFINKYNGQTMEHALPIENVNKVFVGDRYSEYPDSTIPSNADFAAQVTLNQQVLYRES